MPRKKNSTELETNNEIRMDAADAGRKPRGTKAAAGAGAIKKPAAKRRAKSAEPAEIRALTNQSQAEQEFIPEELKPAVSEYEQIALLAYSFWEARGRQGGSPQDDWFRAEREFRRRRQMESEPR